ncbi:ABC transporter permease [Brevibacillus massiliensis]|uniref:ABC transporter permease n=1 Tax=Brevibacillus massiliensis TaxID=1118054 RepID=UPI0004749E1E|nr:iron ABC transporter permease [Brevibacillus massiliensis]
MYRQTFRRSFARIRNGWVALSLLGVAAVLLPNLYILLNLFHQPNENWQHIREYMLKDYVLQSLWLVLCTGICTVLIGVTLAWLVSAYDFPLKRFFRWALILPLAIPPYIAAYTYSTMFSYTGAIQKFFRYQLGMTVDQKYFDVMSVKGAVFIFTMFLFPYVYLITKAFLERQSAAYIESARLLGKNSLQIFFQVVLPISRSAIIGGVSLVVFEVLSDYGVTSYFGIPTFSTAIFQTWFGMYDLDSAVRLAALLMTGIIGLFLLEKLLRSRVKFHSSTSKTRPLKPIKLGGLSAAAAFLFCLAIFSCAFLIPFVQLVAWAKLSYQDVVNRTFIQLTFNTLSVAVIATVVIVVLAAVVANVSRIRESFFSEVAAKLIAMGYSIPGAVIAIGVLSVFISLDQQLSGLYSLLGWGEKKLVLSLSLVMLVFAYVIRFLAVGFNPIEAGFEKVGKQYYEASRMLGLGMTRTFFRVDLPMIRGAVLSASILAFVEITKELPLTLLLRPFNFETLATKTYQYANDEQIIEASIPSLLIIGISMISVLLFHRVGEEKQER